MSRYRIALVPSGAIPRKIDIGVRLTPVAPPAVEASGPPSVDCAVPYCLVHWVGPWIVDDAGPITGSFSTDIAQRLIDEVIPNPPDPDIIIPGGSNNCRIPIVWVLTLTLVELVSCTEAEILSDYTVIESGASLASLREGPWTLVGNGAHIGCGVNVELHAQAYLENKFFPNSDPVPFGDEIIWGIA